jgi:hypothetical protein
MKSFLSRHNLINNNNKFQKVDKYYDPQVYEIIENNNDNLTMH